jgi:hypothetical protein
MSFALAVFDERSRLRALLDHFPRIEDSRDVRRVAHPLAEILLLAVCGTMADCDDYEHIAEWGKAHLPFPGRYLPYEHGVPCGRGRTILMNRINPALFSADFTARVRETWPDRPDMVAIDARPRLAAMIAPSAGRLCTSSRPLPPPSASSRARRPSPPRATRRQRPRSSPITWPGVEA